MATGTRIRQDFIEGTLTSALASGDTTMTSDGLEDLTAIDHATNNEYAAVVIGGEVVHITAHTAAATTATIERGQEGTTATAHDAGATWHHGPTVEDHKDTYPRVHELPVLLAYGDAIAHSDWSTITIDTACSGNARRKSVNSDGVWVEWDVVLEAGTWRIDVAHVTNADQGILDVLLDGASQGTIDTYSASAVRNVAAAVTGITVGTSGLHTIRLQVNGKNASSSGHVGQIQGVTARRTGA